MFTAPWKNPSPLTDATEPLIARSPHEEWDFRIIWSKAVSSQTQIFLNPFIDWFLSLCCCNRFRANLQGPQSIAPRFRNPSKNPLTLFSLTVSPLV